MNKVLSVIRKTLNILNTKQKLLGAILLILTLIGSLFECLGVTAIIPVITVILDPESLRNSRFLQGNNFFSNISYDDLVAWIITAVVIIYLIKNAFFIFLAWIRVKYSCKIQRETSVVMMKSYMSRGYEFFLNMEYGAFSQNIEKDTTKMYEVLNAVFKLLSDTITILLIIFFMFIADWQMSLTMVLLCGGCILLIYGLFRKSMLLAGEQDRVFGIKAGQAMLQAYSGIKEVLINRRQRHFVRAYEDNTIKMQRARIKSTIGIESPAFIIEGICVTGIMIIVGLKVVSGVDDKAFIGVLAAFAVGAFRILPSLGRISVSMNNMLQSVASIDAIYTNMNEAREYTRTHTELDFERKIVTDPTIKFDNNISLKGITFSYRPELGNVLEDVNLEIEKGQAIAFIGTSGAGKSTLVDILLGILYPQKGNISIDGKNISEIPDEWSRMVAYVPQSVFLASSSIRENIAFGIDEEEINDALVWNALERAELKDFVASLPDGIETEVGDRGIRLSGGQRQRIAIARALYHDPQILVLDEATSALDNDTESAIMSAINSLQGSVTMIIVAHRLTTVRNCDKIYEIGNKSITLKDKAEIFS